MGSKAEVKTGSSQTVPMHACVPRPVSARPSRSTRYACCLGLVIREEQSLVLEPQKKKKKKKREEYGPFQFSLTKSPASSTLTETLSRSKAEIRYVFDWLNPMLDPDPHSAVRIVLVAVSR